MERVPTLRGQTVHLIGAQFYVCSFLESRDKLSTYVKILSEQSKKTKEKQQERPCCGTRLQFTNYTVWPRNVKFLVFHTECSKKRTVELYAFASNTTLKAIFWKKSMKQLLEKKLLICNTLASNQNFFSELRKLEVVVVLSKTQKYERSKKN